MSTGGRIPAERSAQPPAHPRLAGLFSGIGGLELGFERAGVRTVAMCEIWEPARRVLQANFPTTPLSSDVREFRGVSDFEILSAGFPCTDLSQAGATAGISGKSSGLVGEVFRIVKATSPRWLVLENVPNMLVLHRGAAMRHITSELELLGYRWAYRTVDARFTGLPQRRLRVILLASREELPGERLLADDSDGETAMAPNEDAFGFYWTEGRGGLGWAVDAIPTLKGGSTIGIPSPPALYLPNAPVGRQLVTLNVRDGEQLQGFAPSWTNAAVHGGERDHRWKLLGNAVPVDVAEWVATIVTRPALTNWCGSGIPLDKSRRWPTAGWGHAGKAWASPASAWPISRPYRHLVDVVQADAMRPLSHRASAGFMRRIDESSLALGSKL